MINNNNHTKRKYKSSKKNMHVLYNKREERRDCNKNSEQSLLFINKKYIQYMI